MAVREGNPQLATRAARAPVQRRAGLSNPVTESASLPALEGRTGSSQHAASDRLSDRTVVAPAVTDDRSGGVCPPLPRLVPLLPSLALRYLPADYQSRATEAHSPSRASSCTCTSTSTPAMGNHSVAERATRISARC